LKANGKLKAELQRSYLRRLFLERASSVPELIPSLKEGLTRSQLGLWQFLTDWSQTWRLDADWVRDSAYKLLLAWPERGWFADDEKGEENYRDSLILTYIPPLPDVVYLPPTPPRYYSTMSHRTRGDYLKQVRAIAISYCEEVEQTLRLAAFKDDPKRDIDWTVRFQVEKEKYSQIAAKDIPKTDNPNRPDPADIARKAVTRTLRIVDLKSRGRN
jgi:hypothetical protein